LNVVLEKSLTTVEGKSLGQFNHSD
jgi:hypothetical protein